VGRQAETSAGRQTNGAAGCRVATRHVAGDLTVTFHSPPVRVPPSAFLCASTTSPRKRSKLPYCTTQEHRNSNGKGEALCGVTVSALRLLGNDENGLLHLCQQKRFRSEAGKRKEWMAVAQTQIKRSAFSTSVSVSADGNPHGAGRLAPPF
jgi:hypothetical protein